MKAFEEYPLVCVIVLNYNGRRHLEYCLPSLLTTDYPNMRLLLVDNASQDGSADWVREHFLDVEVVGSPVNRGWAGGNNLGIARARELGAGYAALVNNDIRAHPAWLRSAVRAAEENPRIGIVGFAIYDAGGSGDTTAFEEAVQRWREPQWGPAEIVDGMAMLVRMSLFDALGPIDEGFFAYAEDNDLVIRARRAGYIIAQVNVPIWHYGGGTFGGRLLWAASLQIRNNLRLALKHESSAGVFYQVARHFAKACLPFVRVNPHDFTARRLRPAHPVVNFGIWAYAVAWNLWHLPATLRRRREDYRRIAETRRQWGDG
ncbi:MAG: glycosyltransferase family 2 protein [Anaerolineae bacterium]